MGKIKEFLSKHKRLRRLLVALVLFVSFFVGFCFGYTAQTVKEQGNGGTAAIRASAEEAAPTAETAPIVYPSENLFDISKVVERSYLKATDTTVTVTNYYAANTGVLLRTFCPKIVAGTYTFSATITSSVPLSNAAASVSLVSSSGGLTQLIRQSKLGYVTNTVTLTEEQLDMSLYFYGVGEGVVSWEKFTCNTGETAYPLLPNFDSIRQEGYEDGYNIGRQDGNEVGYENGYNDGYEAGKADGYEEGFAAG